VDFELSADQELLQETVRRFLAEQAPITPYVRDRLDADTGSTAAVWDGLAGLGVTGLLVPAAHGGAGAGMVEVGAVAQELGRAVHPGPYLASAVGATSLVLLAGTPADHERWLPGLADGTTVGTVALVEPGRPERTGPSAAASAAATPVGDGWALTGTFVHVPDAVGADLVLAVGHTPDGATAVFAVDPAAPGVTLTATPTVDGTRKEATVVLHDTPAHRLGAADASGAVAETVDRLGVAMVLDGVGAAERALELTLEYAKERRQFDQPIGAFQAVQHLCADMLRAVELGRAAGYYAAWACDAADATERHRAATLAQAFAADGLYAVGANAIQVFGGVGFTWEHDAHLYYKRLLTLQQANGGRIGQLEELASLILD
jgi:alkylation response protein AidB-like acyl-CoA dehydrogenase